MSKIWIKFLFYQKWKNFFFFKTNLFKPVNIRVKYSKLWLFKSLKNYNDFSGRIFCCDKISQTFYFVYRLLKVKIFVEYGNSSLDYNCLFFHRLSLQSINSSFNQSNEQTNNLLNENASIVKQHIICWLEVIHSFSV